MKAFCEPKHVSLSIIQHHLAFPVLETCGWILNSPLHPHMLMVCHTTGSLQDWVEMPEQKEPWRAPLSLQSLLACKNSRTCSCFFSLVTCHVIDVSLRSMAYDSEPLSLHTRNRAWSWWWTGHLCCHCMRGQHMQLCTERSVAAVTVCPPHTSCSGCTAVKALTPTWP